MKAKSVSVFTDRLLYWLTITLICFYAISTIFIWLLSMHYLQDSEKASKTLIAIAMPLGFLFFFILLFMMNLDSSTQRFESDIERKKRTARLLGVHLKKINDLLSVPIDDLGKKIKTSSLVVGGIEIELEAVIDLQLNTLIDTKELKNLLEKERLITLKDIEENGNISPKKPKTYAFLEKRLHLTPITQ